MPTCPTCGADTGPDVKEFSGQGITLPEISESVQDLVDSIIESSGYGCS
jgi:hypothetical protein